MEIVVAILTILIILLVLYIVLIQLQLRNINYQLEKRLTEHTRQPVSVELINKDLIKLTVNINRYLKAEENLRLKSIREDRKFRELIVNISHDLRTPLTAIKGYQQLVKKGELSYEQQKKLEIAVKHTDELENLIQYFFEYTYLTNSEPEIDLERTNLNNLVAESLVAFIPILEENNLAVQFKETSPIYVLADKKMVKRIIQNLIRNCIQHSEGDIEVRLLLLKDRVMISFKNPIKDAYKVDEEQLFDRFYTGDRARNKSTGLGLAIVKLLAEQMCGSTEAIVKSESLDIRVSLPLYKNQ
ncbi:Sensor histidine kinase ResE [Bacillus paralicheniformis]|uniref:sensor histidine kinase n=1 Tax=Bacillus paralicheniformis TaxID=1648923 RepID=UPI000C780856|nr:HAMP domain-containing sensor histidine kinase [Bacillus paralicheniformis]MED1068111.1 HAMP domain-containing sensor histidine kinase [Bacillus paralicheniformis]MED1221683.1 HAMP domain-containing sensor histidine kinase [Bacillus paralicheniformis]PLC14254.1 two-component sensor histidine kinase [Bacillus paralicheniformis]TWK83403.1 Sensor histidine kinase ResE [Bacillus paralicheniformis]